MRLQHNKMFMLGGLVCALFFSALLLVRTGVFPFSKRPAAEVALRAGQPPTTGERWMNIFQGDRKIGTTHSRMEPEEDGYRLTERVAMRINTMGLVQDLTLDSRGWLNPDLTLSRFAFAMRSGRFTFNASGQVEDDHLVVRIQSGDSERRMRLPLKAPPYLPAGILAAAVQAGLAPGEQRVFPIFDPSTMAQETITLVLRGRETLQMGENEVDALKVSLSFKGVSQDAWLDEDGELLMEKGLLGIRQVRVSREEALSGLPVSAAGDLTRVAAIVPDRRLPDPAGLKRLTLRLGGIDPGRYRLLGEGRQQLSGNRLTLTREDVDDLPGAVARDDMPPDIRDLLAPSTFVTSDHPKIQALAARLVDPEATPLANLHQLVGWMQANIEKRPVLSLPDALNTLDNRMGDCNEHAVLLAALARAAGYPAQVEAGLVYHEGRFFYHAWNRVYIGRWITVDALFDQIPADVTHIRFARGSAHEQLDILPLLGKLQISILDME